jgi:hypothetical protein
MIIESGFGIHRLLFRDAIDRESWEVRIVCLDSKLQPIINARIADSYLGSLDLHAAEIVPEVQRDEVKYFAIGHRVPDTDPHQEFYRHYEVGRGVIDDLQDRGYAFLGHQVHDAEWWGSSGPMHRFESYVLSDDIPRVLVIPGPHPFMDCTCAVCGPRNAMIAAARATS